MTLQYLNDIKIKDLTMPFKFETGSLEGTVEVYIYQRSKGALTFCGEKLKPYMYSCGKLNLWGDTNGEYTIGQIRQDIINFDPNKYDRVDTSMVEI